MTSYIWFVRGKTHAAMCRTSIESVCKIDREAECIVVTDDPNIGPITDVMYYTRTDALPIMVANVASQVKAMFRATSDKLVFLDTDVLLLGELPHVGDVTVTWRDHVTVNDEGEKQEGIASIMPYNYGVITARFNENSADAFIWMRERIKQMGHRQQEWYGNQLALAELAGPIKKDAVGVEVGEREIPWSLHQPGTRVVIGKIPCERFNYTPQSADEDIDSRYALHFKGKKRDLMKGYAERLGLGWYL